MTLKQDISTVLQALGKIDHSKSVSGPELAELTEMPPERINDAVNLLEGSGYVSIVGTFGNAPFEFSQVEIEPAGRFELERATADAEANTAHAEPSKQATDQQKSQGNRVFLVHGHDEAAKQSAARLIEGLGLPLIILHEQPNQGRTVIEKFVGYSDVAYAVVLFTADDRGGKHDDTYDEQRPRARQNVIFELGFFIGKLGRERVCALYQAGVDIPSDYNGVLFVELDEGGAWKTKLAQEMQALGLPVDLNNVR